MLKCAPPEYLLLHNRILSALTSDGTNPYEWRSLLIGVDGRDGSGKSSLASWLAWQFGMPAIYLDTFMRPEVECPTWRMNDLRRVLDTRLQPSSPKPLIVEGICLLAILEAIKQAPDFLIFVAKHGHEGSHYFGRDVIDPYLAKWCPQKRAQHTLIWTETE